MNSKQKLALITKQFDPYSVKHLNLQEGMNKLENWYFNGTPNNPALSNTIFLDYSCRIENEGLYLETKELFLEARKTPGISMYGLSTNCGMFIEPEGEMIGGNYENKPDKGIILSLGPLTIKSWDGNGMYSIERIKKNDTPYILSKAFSESYGFNIEEKNNEYIINSEKFFLKIPSDCTMNNQKITTHLKFKTDCNLETWKYLLENYSFQGITSGNKVILDVWKHGNHIQDFLVKNLDGENTISAKLSGGIPVNPGGYSYSKLISYVDRIATYFGVKNDS